LADDEEEEAPESFEAFLGFDMGVETSTDTILSSTSPDASSTASSAQAKEACPS
jgi:hypothetical protein